MIIYVDIDDTICTGVYPAPYSDAEPIYRNIRKVNELYDSGHHIVYWTARGTGTSIDWELVTRKQLEEWGARYHELQFGKPIYDIFIDDKAINARSWEMAP